MQKPTTAFYGLLSLPATAMGFALCVQISALSWILNTKYGLDLEEIGLVWLAGPLAGILGQVLIGVISDNVWFMNGRRRPFIVIGGTIAALAILALPYLDVVSASLGIAGIATVALTVALALDLAINISFNPARSIVADVTPEGEARTKGYTIMQTVSGALGVAAYLIAFFFNPLVLIYVGAVVVLLLSVIPPFFIKEPRSLSGTPDAEAELATAAAADPIIDEVAVATTDPTLKRKTDWPEFLKICLAHAFTWVGVQAMFIYTFGYIKSSIMGFEVEADLPGETSELIGKQIGFAFAILNTVGFLFPALVLEPITRQIGRVKTHAAALFISAVGYGLIVMYGTSIYAFYTLMAVVGVGWAAVVSLPFAIMSDVVDSRRMGLMMGLFNLSVVLPQVVASLLGGYIEAAPDKSIIFVIAGGTLLVSAALWLLVKERGTVGNLEAGGGH